MIPVVTAVAVFALMGVEAALSRSHERALRAAGAVEPADDVYPVMRVTYPAAFLLMCIEGLWRGAAGAPWLTAGLLVFLAGKTIKYSAMASLGRLWSFRVLVVPGASLVRSGPYRFLRHPNYLGIMGELAGTAMIAASPVTGAAALVTFAWILRKRIAVEERMLSDMSVSRQLNVP